MHIDQQKEPKLLTRLLVQTSNPDFDDWMEAERIVGRKCLYQSFIDAPAAGLRDYEFDLTDVPESRIEEIKADLERSGKFFLPRLSSVPMNRIVT